MITKESIAALKPRVSIVAVPEWSGEIGIRVMTGTDRNSFEQNFDDGKTPRDFREQLIVRCLCDESGKRLYENDEVGELLRCEAHVIHRLYLIASEANGLTKAALETAEKN